MQIERFQWQHSVLKCSCCASIVDDWSTARSMTKARDESLWPSAPNRKGNAVRLNKSRWFWASVENYCSHYFQR
jgi:hypothetical protein